MKLLDFVSLNKTIAFDKLNDAELIKEIQSVLVELDLLDKADGFIGKNTINAFKRFKEINYQSNPDFIGAGSAKLLISAYDKEPSEDDDHKNFVEIIAPNQGYKVGDINWNDFNCPIAQFFTVGEVTKNSINRIPTTKEGKLRAIALAKELDKIRIATGSPIIVTSWSRPLAVNRAVGGATNSQHLYGGAVDIFCEGQNIFDFQKFVDANWDGAFGFGAPKGFVHLDMRNGKGWETGGNKGVRWNY
jgi:putative chitinase